MIEEKIKQWLMKQGYPLEMATAKTFREQNYQIRQSEFFFDATGDKHREIDLICEKDFYDIANSILFAVSFIVECKTSPNKPWLLLTSLESQPTEHLDSPTSKTIIINKRNNEVLSNVDRIKELQKNGFIKGSPRTATGLVTALKERNQDIDPAYGAVIAVAKAARARAKMGNFNFGNLIYKHAVGIMFPIVLLDSSLFEGYLDTNNAIQIKSVGWGRLLLKNPDAGSELNVIDIVEKRHLKKYLQLVEYDFKLLLGIGKTNSELLKNNNISMMETFDKIVGKKTK